MEYKIIFSQHALFQIKERRLSKSEIIATVFKPDKITVQPLNKFQAIKLIDRGNKKYLMIAVCRNENSCKKVITAFLTTKIKKYLF